jgi:hypothetical protein
MRLKGPVWKSATPEHHACKQPVSAIDEAMANIDHQIVISAPQPPDRRPENASQAAAQSPTIYRWNL